MRAQSAYFLLSSLDVKSDKSGFREVLITVGNPIFYALFLAVKIPLAQ